jgi:hypothetical protein
MLFEAGMDGVPEPHQAGSCEHTAIVYTQSAMVGGGVRPGRGIPPPICLHVRDGLRSLYVRYPNGGSICEPASIPEHVSSTLRLFSVARLGHLRLGREGGDVSASM